MPEQEPRRFTPKSPEELAAQLRTAGEALGEPLHSSDEERTAMLGLDAEALKERYGRKYEAYRKSLVATERGTPPPIELADWVRALNRLEQSVAAEGGEAGFLRPHQREVYRDLLEFFQEGHERGHIKLPTGAGKTAIFLKLAEATGLRTLVLVPRKQLVEQTDEKIQEYDLELEASRYFSDAKDIGGDLVISTYQSMEKLLDEAEAAGQPFRLVIADEAHRALTERVQGQLDRLSEHAVILGLTATPKFSEEKDVARVFGELVHEMDVEEGIMLDILSGARCIYVRTDLGLGSVPRERGDYNQRQLEQALDVAKRNRVAIDLLANPSLRDPAAPELPRSTIAFCLSRAHARKLAAQAREAGIPAEAIDGTMDPDERDEILDRYGSGQTRLLCSVDMLQEGWDEPRTEIAINLRPTMSLVVAEQRLGRALRKREGKPYAVIFDLLDLGDETTQPAGTRRPITAVDILGGHVVLPPRVAEQVEHSGFGAAVELPDLLDVQVVTQVEEMLALHPSLPSETEQQRERFTFTSPEDFRAVLAASGYGTPEAIGSILDESPSAFLRTHLRSDVFRGTGRELVARYYADIRSEPLERVFAQHTNEFFDYVLGDLSKKLRILHTPPQRLAEFFRLIAGRMVREALEMRFWAGRRRIDPSLDKGGVVASGRDLLAAFDIPEPPDGYGLAAFAELATTIAARAGATETLRHAAEYYSDRATAAVARERPIAVPIRARLEFLRAHRDVIKMTRREFEELMVPGDDGTLISGWQLLEAYGVDATEKLEDFLRKYFPAELRQRVQAERNIARRTAETMRLQFVFDPTFVGSVVEQALRKADLSDWPSFGQLREIPIEAVSEPAPPEQLQTLYDLVAWWQGSRSSPGGRQPSIFRYETPSPANYKTFQRIFGEAVAPLQAERAKAQEAKKQSMADLIRARLEAKKKRKD